MIIILNMADTPPSLRLLLTSDHSWGNNSVFSSGGKRKGESKTKSALGMQKRDGEQ